MSKDGFHFAAANRIVSQIPRLDCNYLVRFADVGQLDDSSLVEFLAALHVEFILLSLYGSGTHCIADDLPQERKG